MENFSLRTQLLSLSNHSSKVIIPMYNHGCFQRALLFQVVLRDEISDPTFNLRNFLQRCLGFGCRRQQKHHTAAPPPAAVRRRMERERQKLVGRDKGSLTELQTEGNRNNNGTDKEKTQQRTAQATDPLSRTGPAPCTPELRVSSRRHPHPLEPSVTAHGMEYRALFGQVGSARPAVPLPGVW